MRCQITFVDRQLIDSSHDASPFLTKADSSCYRLTIKSGEAAPVFSYSFSSWQTHGKMWSMHLIDFMSHLIFYGGIVGFQMFT